MNTTTAENTNEAPWPEDDINDVRRPLHWEWIVFSVDRLGFGMDVPQIEFVADVPWLGQWDFERGVIRLSYKLLTTEPWVLVLQVFREQMVHQYVHQVQHQPPGPAHDAAFRQECRRLGLGQYASGHLQEDRSEQEQRITQRIMRLLALAESPNQHEAEAAMQEAQRLMLKYNVEAEQGAARGQREYSFRYLGQPKSRFFEHEYAVADILERHFFVKTLFVWADDPRSLLRGRILEICGTPPNLDMAAYVYEFLHRTGEWLWVEHKRQEGIRGDQDRRQYMAGVMDGFAAKLQTQRIQVRQEGLVWAGDKDLEGYFDRRHPKIGSGYTTAGAGHGEARAHGFRAGHEIVLHRPVTTSGSSSGRLLRGKDG